MRAAEKPVGVDAVIMALCCALLPFAGAALGGGLVAVTGTVGVIIGVALLGGIAAFLWRRRRSVDVEMEIVDLVPERDKVVGRFLCSGTHTGGRLHQLGLA